MKSNSTSEPLDLDRDLPTTPEDVAVLWRLRHGAPLDFEGYLEFLKSFPCPPASVLRLRRGPRGDEPFEL